MIANKLMDEKELEFDQVNGKTFYPAHVVSGLIVALCQSAKIESVTNNAVDWLKINNN